MLLNTNYFERIKQWLSEHKKMYAVALPWALAVLFFIYAYIKLGKTFDWL